MGRFHYNRAPNPQDSPQELASRISPARGPRGGEAAGNKEAGGLRLVKFHKGPDTLIILLETVLL